MTATDALAGAAPALTGTHDPWLVLLSLLVAVGTSTVAMRLAHLARGQAPGRARQLALASGAVSLGTGIWAMHFVGMLAFDLHVTVRYDLATTLASVLPALAASWIALRLLSTDDGRPGRLWLAGSLMGAGIGAMHFGGMAGLRMAPQMHHQHGMLALSLVAAVGLSTAALWIQRRLQAAGPGRDPWRCALLAGAVGGSGITLMHYLGMAAARFEGRPEPDYARPDAALALGVALVVTVATLGALLANLLIDRQRALVALRRESERLNAVMDTMVDALVTIDRQGTILSVNRATERLFGWSAAELVGQSLHRLMPERHRGAHDRRFAAHLADGSTTILGRGTEVEARHRDGREFPVRVGISRTDIDGETCFVGVMTDLRATRETERAALAARSEVESFMTALSEHSIVSVTDPQGTLLHVNAGFCAISGYTADELIGRNHRLISSGTHAPAFWAEFWRTLRAGRPWRGEICNRAKDGSLYWVDSLITPVLDERGVIRRHVSIRHDITDRKLREQELDEQRQRLAQVLEGNRIGTWSWDAGSGRGWHEVAAAGLLGLGGSRLGPLDDVVWESLVHPEDRPALSRLQQALREGRESVEGVLRLRGTDGAWHWIQSRGRALVHDDQARPRTWHGTHLDISDLVTARETAEAAAQAKDRFLAVMSHELRTPLNAVLGFAQVLETDPALDGDQRDSVAEILKAGHHLLTLINEVLDLARINAGQVDMRPEALALAPLLQEAEALISPLARARRVRLRVVVPATPLAARADRVRLKQVLLNLLSNAVKYDRQGGEVVLTLTAIGDERVRLAVSDTGPGIAPERLPELFRPFHRLDAERGQVEGSGMGLTISQRLVDLMGGSIGVHSRPGEGCTFHVDLPRAPDTAAQPVEPEGPAP